MKGFYPSDKGPRRKRPARVTYSRIDKIHHDRASNLHKAIIKARMLMEPYNENKWAHDFRSLQVKLSKLDEPIQPNELDDTLTWYIQEIGKDYLPRCSSVRSFKKFFLEIYKAKKDAVGLFVKVDPNQVDPLMEIFGSYRYNWPDNALEYLPSAIQLSLDHYHPFYKIAVEICKEMVSKIKRCRDGSFMLPVRDSKDDVKNIGWCYFADKLVGEAVGGCPQDLALFGPPQFVKHWFIDIYQLRRNWPEWDGDLKRDVWHMDHKLWHQQMRKFFSNEEWRWNEFFQLVKERM